MSNSSHANITKFASENFKQWKFQVHILLKEEEVLDFIADNAACPILANMFMVLFLVALSERCSTTTK